MTVTVIEGRRKTVFNLEYICKYGGRRDGDNFVPVNSLKKIFRIIYRNTYDWALIDDIIRYINACDNKKVKEIWKNESGK